LAAEHTLVAEVDVDERGPVGVGQDRLPHQFPEELLVYRVQLQDTTVGERDRKVPSVEEARGAA
jgi:hypothetical protein